MRFWDHYSSWQEAETAWEEKSQKAANLSPIKKLRVLPNMMGITPETARRLKWKSFKYMLFHKEGLSILKSILGRPFFHFFSYLRSLLKKRGYKREGDFFFYNVDSEEHFVEEAQKKECLKIVGFSYCQKPFECPSGRFTSECIHSSSHPICQQCEIGKFIHALPEENIVPLAIPTVHYIGKKIFELKKAHPHKRLLFLITACELTLEMFADWGNMVGIQGIGIRLDGRICNTMKAFELSEAGIKPGLTLLTQETHHRLLHLIKRMRERPF